MFVSVIIESRTSRGFAVRCAEGLRPSGERKFISGLRPRLSLFLLILLLGMGDSGA